MATIQEIRICDGRDSNTLGKPRSICSYLFVRRLRFSEEQDLVRRAAAYKGHVSSIFTNCTNIENFPIVFINDKKQS